MDSKTAQLDAGRDTVMFLPHRLNRQPVIVRGLTADELWITVGLSAAGGFALGVPCAVLTHQWPLLPTVIVACVAVGVFAGGALLRRQKRGRPETWLYRQLQWWMRHHLPALAGFMGGNELIAQSGYWSTHRTRREGLR